MGASLHSACLLLLIMLLSSCFTAYEKPFRVGINTWPGYAPLYIAKRNSLFRNKNIDVIELPSTTETIHALAMGNLEAAALTLDEVLTVIDLGIDVQIVMILDTSNGADALVAKPYIESISELKGRTLAVERSAVGAFMLDQALTSVNLSIDEINVINCSYNQHMSCYELADGIVTFEPTVTRLVSNGGVVLFDSGNIPNSIIDVLAVKREVINEYPETVVELIEGYYRSREFMRVQPDLTSQYLSKFMRTDIQNIEATLEKIYLPTQREVVDLMGGSPSSLTQTARRLEGIMKSNDLLLNYQEPEQLITNAFITQ